MQYDDQEDSANEPKTKAEAIVDHGGYYEVAESQTLQKSCTKHCKQHPDSPEAYIMRGCEGLTIVLNDWEEIVSFVKKEREESDSTNEQVASTHTVMTLKSSVICLWNRLEEVFDEYAIDGTLFIFFGASFNISFV
jgi:hypothetical protein